MQSPRTLRIAASACLVALLGSAIAGCDTPRVADSLHPRLTDPSKRHPITVVAETATLDVAIGSLPKGSEARAYVETTRFVRNYGYEGRGDLTIAVPSGSRHRASARLGQINLAAHRAGVPSNRVRIVQKPGGLDTITLSYDRIAAIGPTCGQWGSDITRNPDNLPYENWGCASQRNLAAMTANPTDLMFPANERARGSETRASDAKNFKEGVGKSVNGGGGGGGGAPK